MKKTVHLIFSFLIMVTILLSIMVIAEGENLTLRVSNINATNGSQNVSVPILLENNITLYGIQIEILHHPHLIFKDVALANRTNSSIIEANEVNGTILIAGISELGISPGNGTLFSLIFDISPNANGIYVLNSTNQIGVDLSTLMYSVEFVPGNVQIN